MYRLFFDDIIISLKAHMRLFAFVIKLSETECLIYGVIQ